MTTSFKRAAAAGFTLIELLIVVIILAIISAIAIPQFTSATSDAQQSAADANLAAVRNAIELYRAQHAGNAYPGLKPSTGGSCTGGTEGIGGENSEEAFKDQLMYASDKDGRTCSIADATYRYGPYLRQGIPNNPFTDSNSVRMEDTGAKLEATTGPGKSWAYDTKSGQFILDAKEEAIASGNNGTPAPGDGVTP